VNASRELDWNRQEIGQVVTHNYADHYNYGNYLFLFSHVIMPGINRQAAIFHAEMRRSRCDDSLLDKTDCVAGYVRCKRAYNKSFASYGYPSDYRYQSCELINKLTSRLERDWMEQESQLKLHALHAFCNLLLNIFYDLTMKRHGEISR